MTRHRKIMVFLTALVFGSAGAWAKSQWRDADRSQRHWIVGIVACAGGAAVVGLLRVVGIL